MGFTVRSSLILPQSIQISWLYLKFDKKYDSDNTCVCSRYAFDQGFALVQGLGIFIYVEDLWFCYLLGDKYFVYVVKIKIFV